MRLLRIGMIVAFAAVCVATVMLYLTNGDDGSVPVLECSVEEIRATCNVKNEELLQYVTAYDAEDGVLTNGIVVESISGFLEKGVSNVVFAVSDNDNNVVKRTVKLIYTDYRDPVFSSNNDLLFYLNERADLSENIRVRDPIDGDLTGWLISSADNFTTAEPGKYEVTYSVTTSKSYTYSLTFPVIVENAEKTLYDIVLSQNIIYCKPGASIDYNSYVDSIQTPYSEGTDYKLIVDASTVDLSKPGVYDAFYYAKVGNETVAKTRLIIICEGE